MVSEDQLKQAYDEVLTFTEKTQDSGFSLELAKSKLDAKILEGTFEGKIQGKNEGERKAIAMHLFQQDFADIDAKEYEYRMESKLLSLSRIHLDFLRDCIRIEELAKK